MSHVDRIQHPLLILHGTSDVNVPFLHSMLLVEPDGSIYGVLSTADVDAAFRVGGH